MWIEIIKVIMYLIKTLVLWFVSFIMRKVYRYQLSKFFVFRKKAEMEIDYSMYKERYEKYQRMNIKQTAKNKNKTRFAEIQNDN